MKLSYSTWGMPHVPIEAAVAHCASLGFDGLELAVIPGWSTDAAGLDGAERRRIRDLYDHHGLDICGLSGNVSLLADTEEAHRDAIDRFHSYLELAAELQHSADHLIVTTTSAGKAEAWDARRQELVDILGQVAEHAAGLGVRVGIEPHVGTALRTPYDVLWVVREVDHPALTVHFDISHFNVQGLDMDDVVATLAPHSLHTHVKDERGIVPNHQFLIPGEGDMNYVRYLRAMAAAGYTGHIVVEISIMVQDRPNFDALAAATQSYQVLSHAFDEAGIARTLE